MVICWQMGKTFCKEKTQLSDFKAITSKNLLINNQIVTSMRNLTTTLAYFKIPTYSWIFAPIPNWTWFCGSFLSFDVQISNLWLIFCTDLSTWLTLATWIIVIDCKVLHFINNEDQEALGYKILWRINVVASYKETKTLGLCFHVWWLLK